MSEELPPPPARVHGVLYQRSLSSLRKNARGNRNLEPVVDWQKWQATRGGKVIRTAAENAGANVWGGFALSGAGAAITISTPHLPGAEAVLLFGLGMLTVGALAFTSSIAGTWWTKTRTKPELNWLKNASRIQLANWLQAEWGITPVKSILPESGRFGEANVAELVNTQAVSAYMFEASNGKRYKLERTSTGGSLSLNDLGSGVVAATPSSGSVSPSAAVIPQKPALRPLTSTPMRVPRRPVVDPLAAFNRADLAVIEQTTELAQELAASDTLGVEQRYEVERAQKTLDDALGLAAKLSVLNPVKKKVALADLMDSVRATARGLRKLADARDDSVMREVEVLRNYTSALNPQNATLSLPE